ncbi:MAG: guanylate kinase [Oscillospiraceae bacterium]|nr:guanylate kinase [Oscillospiraceae bacterium]
MKKKGLLIVVSGPSGVGKGTICKEYLSQYENCALSVSATTRSPREGEVDGVNYFFISHEEFRKKIDAGGFLEHAVFCDNYYGTPKDAVMEKLEEGKNVILEIEVQGALQVRSHYPEAVFVFVIPPSMEELESRLRGRGTESEDVIAKRLERAKAEFKYIDKYNYILVNDTVSEAVDRLSNIIKAEDCVMARNYKFIEEEFIK